MQLNPIRKYREYRLRLISLDALPHNAYPSFATERQDLKRRCHRRALDASHVWISLYLVVESDDSIGRPRGVVAQNTMWELLYGSGRL